MADSKDAFRDSRIRVAWAKENFTNFERSAKRFFNRAPAGHVIEPHSDGVHEIHKFKLFKPLPATLTKNTVALIESLRASLDLLAVSVGRLVQLPTADDLHFPFCKAAIDLKSRINSACKGLPDDIKSLWAGFKPYQGGSDLLFAINELCVASKHRIIVPVASQVGVNLPYLETSDIMTSPIVITEGVMESEENEITYAITQRGLKWKHHAQFAFTICFGKVGIAEGREVRSNLPAMIETVTTIIDATESECFRIGLL